MLKHFYIASLAVIISTTMNCMQKNEVNDPMDIRVKQRIAAYNEWKSDTDETKMGIKKDSALFVLSYIHLTMFLRESEAAAKAPAKIAEATQLAQQICPSYTYWKEYYECFSRCKRGKRYSHEEHMELVLGPIMQEMSQLKVQIALLKAAELSSISLKPDWKKEVELVQPKNGSLLDLIPLALPPKQQELAQLKKELEQLSSSENLQKVIDRAPNSPAAPVEQLPFNATPAQLAFIDQENERVKLQESYQRIRSSFALLQTSKKEGWEKAFVQVVKDELSLSDLKS